MSSTLHIGQFAILLSFSTFIFYPVSEVQKIIFFFLLKDFWVQMWWTEGTFFHPTLSICLPFLDSGTDSSFV